MIVVNCTLSYLFDGVSLRSDYYMETLINEKLHLLNPDQMRLLNRIIDAIADDG